MVTVIFSLLLNAFTLYTLTHFSLHVTTCPRCCVHIFLGAVSNDCSIVFIYCCVYDLKALFDFEHRLNGLGASV